jgi:hypothetical protein
MKTYLKYFILVPLIFGAFTTKAQLEIKVGNGLIYINDRNLGHLNFNKYSPLIDSLDKSLKLHPNDTTSLFERALLFEQFNNQLAKATSLTREPIENLTIAKDLAEHAMVLNMKDIRLKVLQAQIYKDLVYRFSFNESWKFTSKEILERKQKRNTYKELANNYYDELALIDKDNAYNYEKLKVK